jgi:hypothetical protein
MSSILKKKLVVRFEYQPLPRPSGSGPGSPSLRSVAAPLPEEAKPREFLFISPFFFLALLIN